MRVSQMTTAGLSPAGTESKAVSRALMSLPSTRTVRHPKACHLSTIGSVRSTPAVGPSACRPFMSTTHSRLPSPWWDAAIAASQVEPSSSSPSLIMLITRAVLPWNRRPRAMPTATPRPWPSEPPEISMPGV